jgi:hypothetical protein
MTPLQGISINLIDNPILIAELIAKSYRISPELVFINRKTKYRNIRKEWISVLLSKGYLLADIKEITNWTKKQIEEDYFSEIIHY